MEEQIYYSIAIASMAFALFKLGISKLSLFAVLVFSYGIFSYLGLGNEHSVLVVLYAVFLALKKSNARFSRYEMYINSVFLIFTAAFFISYYIHGGGILTIISQYTSYAFIFILYYIFRDLTYHEKKRERVKEILLLLIYIQVFLSVVKIGFYGVAGRESIVGSMAYDGGGFAVAFPLIAMVFYWAMHKDRMNLWNWLIIASFLLVALASGKRTPIVIFPVLAFLMIFAGRDRTISAPVKVAATVVVLIAFYFGLRLIPIFNPENIVWGSFDLRHAVQASSMYFMGTPDPTMFFSDDYVPVGRGGSLYLLLNPSYVGFSGWWDYLFGHGLYEVATRAHGRFTASGGYDVALASGNLTHYARELYALGYLGLFSMLLLAFSIIYCIKSKHVFRVVFAVFFLELLLYANNIAFNNVSAMLVVFIIFYSNVVFKN